MKTLFTQGVFQAFYSTSFTCNAKICAFTRLHWCHFTQVISISTIMCTNPINVREPTFPEVRARTMTCFTCKKEDALCSHLKNKMTIFFSSLDLGLMAMMGIRFCKCYNNPTVFVYYGVIDIWSWQKKTCLITDIGLHWVQSLTFIFPWPKPCDGCSKITCKLQSW